MSKNITNKRREIRYYLRFDIDLIALIQNGVNITKYLPQILSAYAKGQDITLTAPFCKGFNTKEVKRFIRQTFVPLDEESVQLLESVRPGFRNTFCKALLRQALRRQQLGAFFKPGTWEDRENEETKLLAKEKRGIVLDTKTDIIKKRKNKSKIKQTDSVWTHDIKEETQQILNDIVDNEQQQFIDNIEEETQQPPMNEVNIETQQDRAKILSDFRSLFQNPE